MNDIEIIDLFFERSETAITEIDIKYGKICLNVAHNILKNVHDSEECVNDTYLSLWNSIPPNRPNKLMAFTLKVTRNLALKRLEYNTARKRNPDVIISFSELEDVISNDLLSSDLEDKEIGRLLNSFLRNAKQESRKVFIRRYYFLDSISDISSRYGYSESKVKNMLYHTRKKLREYLEKEGIVL